MPFEVTAFFESIDAATIDNITPLDDDHYFSSGDDKRVRAALSNLIGYAAIGATMTQARLEAPSLRTRGGIEILPIDDAAEPTSNFPPIMFPENPIAMKAGEKLRGRVTETTAGAVDQTIVCWFADGPITPLTGVEIFPVGFTTSMTCTADAWADSQITLDRALDAGTYQVVGAYVISTTGILFRFIFDDDVARGGGICYDDEADIADAIFRNGKLGVWGEFTEDSPPRLEIYCAAADTNPYGVLDLVKVS